MEHNFYKKIKMEILDIINKNVFTPNFVLPSENMLARKFNASRSTVRKALNELVQESKIQKVKGKGSLISDIETDTQRKLHYALILPSSDTYFADSIIRFVIQCCREKNIDITVMLSRNSTPMEELCLKNARLIKADGILLMPVDNDKYNSAILELVISKFPCVLIDRKLFGLDLPCVSSNHYQIGYKATEYLCQKHSEIAIFSFYKDLSSSKERLDGYTDALQKYNSSAKSHTVLFSHSEFMNNIEGATNKTIQFLKDNEKISAIISNSGKEYIIINKALAELNRNFDFVFIDNNFTEYESPLTRHYASITQDEKAIAYTAVEMLCDIVLNNIQQKNVAIEPILKPATL